MGGRMGGWGGEEGAPNVSKTKANGNARRRRRGRPYAVSAATRAARAASAAWTKGFCGTLALRRTVDDDAQGLKPLSHDIANLGAHLSSGNRGELPQVLQALGAQPPEDSATIAMKLTPRWGHSVSVFRWLHLHASYKLAAAPALPAASATTSCRCG